MSPVIAPGVERWPVYLPAGRWVDVWTGTEHPGGQVIDLPAPIEQIPVLARGEAAHRHLARFADLPAA